MHERKRLYRCAADIRFDDTVPSKGKILDVHLKDFSETCNCLQYQRPLTRRRPCFFVHVISLASTSQVTIGIAGPDIQDDIPPGCWNGTVGYSSSGQCYSSHKTQANTSCQKFTAGDWLGVQVTYFGKDTSTVLFLKNGVPVATRYLFEADHKHFLPTIALANGPVTLGVMWPQAVVTLPSYSERNMQHWIKSAAVSYKRKKNLFSLDDKTVGQSLVQSPCPFSKEVKMEAGQRMGFGIQYDPEQRTHSDFEDKEEQLVLCYVTVDSEIVFAHVMLQPPGGWFPRSDSTLTGLTPDDRDSPLEDRDSFQDSNRHGHKPVSGGLILDQFRMSEKLVLDIGLVYTRVTLPRQANGIHVIQFSRPLTPRDNYFDIEVKAMGDSSMVCVGIADSSFPPLTRFPGKTKDTLGYNSRDGRMYSNNKDKGNTTGKRYGKVAICGNGSEVIIDIVWQNRVSDPPVFNVTNVEHWCLPEESTVDVVNNIVYVDHGHTEVETIQAPYSLHRTLKAVKKTDLMGWGLLYPDDTKHHDAEQLVICYLTINRSVSLTRVMYQPPGGFYPVILLPPGVHRVKLNFDATIITDHPFTPEMVKQLLTTAEEMITEEERQVSNGADPEDWDSAENKGKYLRPLPITEKAVERFREKLNPSSGSEVPGLRRKTHKMANLVELMMKVNLDTNDQANHACETTSSICTIT
ncbi:hypothetical protein NP493_337g00013 [Ridgeia piscesae]|uniref:SPRY domain-containing protein n=1 Tax=Ridgeia piscesae TaxID=27915 RepID=A0AAD9NUE4_RIDPI|nr:hypothetical protein NP493_337g00013 [Ridgeia piscesae]